MLANDELGKLREDFRNPLPDTYYKAFENIANDPNQELVVIENEDGDVIGTLQLSFIQYLTYQGGIRAQIEAVRVHEQYRKKASEDNCSYGPSNIQKKKEPMWCS